MSEKKFMNVATVRRKLKRSSYNNNIVKFDEIKESFGLNGHSKIVLVGREGVDGFEIEAIEAQGGKSIRYNGFI